MVASFGRHTEGRDLMSCVLEAIGFETIVVGRDRTLQDAVDLCRDPDVTALCVSVQTTFDCPEMYRTSRMMEKAGVRDRVVLNIGGSPINEVMAEAAGCDVFSHTASESARMIAAEVLSRRGIGPRGQEICHCFRLYVQYCTFAETMVPFLYSFSRIGLIWARYSR